MLVCIYELIMCTAENPLFQKITASTSCCCSSHPPRHFSSGKHDGGLPRLPLSRTSGSVEFIPRVRASRETSVAHNSTRAR